MEKSIKKFSKQQLIAIIVAVVLAIIIIPSGIKCIVYKESPAQLVADAFTPNTKQIVGKWQGDESVTAYEFFDDGTYESYLSTFSYKGKYEISGSKITLTNTSMAGSVEYKFSVNGDNLSMKLLKENGVKAEEKSKQTYKKVDVITMQSFSDILDELKNQQAEADNKD